MSVEIIAPHELDAGLTAAWDRLRSADDDLKSPFFAPDFCRVIGRVRPDLRIAVIRDAGEVCGLFPFHRQRFGRLAPLAGQISDYHGIVGAPGPGGIDAVLRAAGAQAYDFNHMPVSQSAFAAQAFRRTASPLVDLTGGFEAWRAGRRAATGAIRDVERRTRKLTREVGPIRFVANDTSPEAWAAFLDWKRAALAAVGVDFILDRPWARDVAETIRDHDGAGLAGMTSTLRAGDRLAAVHFGMRGARAWHWWFPAYNVALGRYSPGLALILEVLRHAEATGIDELDFGRGNERYKSEFANRHRMLCEGSVERGLSPLGLPRRLRKAVQKPLSRGASVAVSEFARKVGDRLLVAGRLT